MPDTLRVAINRDEGGPIVPESTAFETDGTFTVALRNHGQPTHVHLRLEGPLAEVARVEAPNHYLSERGARTVTVRVHEASAPIDGKLKLVTGYGQESAYVTVRIADPAEHDPGVEVDESLTEPTGGASQATARDADTGVAIGTAVPVVLLAVLATGLAIGSALWFQSVAVRIGVVAVLVGVLVALFLLIRS